MAAKINHVAIVSDRYTLAAKFYEIVFGMRLPQHGKLINAITIGDGYVGMNINPRGPGRPAGLDHFGFEVDDLEATLARMAEKYPETHALKRPGNRAFASYTGHDPDGNAQFYVDVFGLERRNTMPGDENRRLTDGRMTLTIMPWRIEDYAGTGITRPGPDHIGFRVENLDDFKRHLRAVVDENPHLAPRPIDVGKEYQARLRLLEASDRADFHLGDVDGVLIGVTGP